MKDITERLRAFKTGCDRKECERMIFTPLVCEEAADEIERLMAALHEIGYGTGVVTENNGDYLFKLIDIAQSALSNKKDN